MDVNNLWIELENHINYLFTIIDNDEYSVENYLKGYNLCYTLLKCDGLYKDKINKMEKIYFKSLSLYARKIVIPLLHKTHLELAVDIDICYKKFNKISSRLRDIMMHLDQYKYDSKLSLKDSSKLIFREYVYKFVIEPNALKSDIDNNIFNDENLSQQLLIMYNDMKNSYTLSSNNKINQKFIIEI